MKIRRPILDSALAVARMNRSHHIKRFAASRQAGATAITAMAFTLMSLMGVAFVGDHVYLAHQRDTLKFASDAAGLATALHMGKTDPGLSDEELNKKLMPIAKRYILANLPEKWRAQTADNLKVTLTPNRVASTVDVSAEASLGGTAFGSLLGNWGWSGIGSRVRVGSGSERITSVTEVVLVIDVTKSMLYNLRGNQPSGPNSRIEIVKRAAADLVDILKPDGDDHSRVAIGIVPWSYYVRFDSATATTWETQKWATYPTQRYYPDPYVGAPSGGETFDADTIPAKGSRSWNGCTDQRLKNGIDPPNFLASTPDPLDMSLTTPDLEPFTMNFYTPMLSTTDVPVSLPCRAGLSPYNRCYVGWGGGYKLAAQSECPPSASSLKTLTTDKPAIKAAIKSLSPIGSATYSTVGLIWGRRLLAPTWRSVWGHAIHPVDPAQEPKPQKALVLLTDGEDNHLSWHIVNAHRQKVCGAVKADGIKVFVIAALVPNPRLVNSLENCSSKADDPDGSYVFVNNATPENLEEAFREIARQLVRFRRTY